jgi:H+/Cl- antiporter ClcA
VLARGGAAAALAAVFRAPLSGALMAAEHEGQLAPDALIPCLVAAASGLWLPSLAMGAALGVAFDGWLDQGQTRTLTLVGASALAGATHQTLLVPVVFLAETTGQTALVVPALIGTTVAYLVVRER